MAKILLVEDDNNLREIYEARLAAEGYDIVSARDGEEALTVAMKEKPDLIISDVMMPKICGFDMLDILRTTEETKNAKIIMMTALSQAEDKQRAEKLGADRYLVKSQVTLEDVAKVAHDVLEGKPAGEEPTLDVATVAPTKEQPAATAASTSAPAPDTPAPEPAAASAIPTPQPAPAPEPTTATTPTPDPASSTPAKPVTPAAQPQPESATGATPAADPATSTLDPSSDSNTTQSSTGLDAVSASQPASDDSSTSIPVGTPSDDATTDTPTPDPAPEPDSTDKSADSTTADPVTESVQTEEQVIAQHIKDSLNIGKDDSDTKTPVDPMMNNDATQEQTAEQPAETAQEAAPPVEPSSSGKKIEPINDVNAPSPDLAAMAAKEAAPADSPAPAASVEPTVIEPTDNSKSAAPAQSAPETFAPSTNDPAASSPSEQQGEDADLPKPATPPTESAPKDGVDPNSIAL